MSRIPSTIAWIAPPEGPAVRMIDQTRLPGELVMIDCRTVEQLCEAIGSLRVRGAPALGCAAGYGLALAAHLSSAITVDQLVEDLSRARATIAATRPTAVNLFWALERVMAVLDVPAEDAHRELSSVRDLRGKVLAEAELIAADDLDRCVRLGRYGAELLADGANVITHCNAGALACAGYGTALGVMRAAAEGGKRLHVWVDETSPLLQGARLTAWELIQEGIPCTVLCDNMAGWLMAQGKVDCVLVGADRIAANGDAANKIGTYGLAVLAQAHGLPFYVAAPLSTLDLDTTAGTEIRIEQRSPEEVSLVAGRLREPITPTAADIYNPAFDVTPAELITAIITEVGVFAPPYEKAFCGLQT